MLLCGRVCQKQPLLSFSLSGGLSSDGHTAAGTREAVDCSPRRSASGVEKSRKQIWWGRGKIISTWVHILAPTVPTSCVIFNMSCKLSSFSGKTEGFSKQGPKEAPHVKCLVGPLFTVRAQCLAVKLRRIAALPLSFFPALPAGLLTCA